jgi:hypothetical protein
MSNPGMVVRKLFRIAFALFLKAHRTAFALRSHFAFASHFSHIFRIFALSSPFFVILQLIHQKDVKSAIKLRKICKKKKVRKIAKCECNAKIESKFASHRTTVRKRFRIFSHRIRIALPSLVKSILYWKLKWHDKANKRVGALEKVFHAIQYNWFYWLTVTGMR